MIGRWRQRAILERHARQLRRDVEAAIEAFRARAYDRLSARLGQAFGLPIKVNVESDCSGDAHAVVWCPSSSSSAFTFEATLTTHPSFVVLVQRWLETVPLLLHVHRKNPHLRGSMILNLGDCGSFPGLAFCDFRPEFTLIPDSQFLASRGYGLQKAIYDGQDIDWASRHPRALWRGQTSGWHDASGRDIGHWRDLPRVRLCQLSQGVAGRAHLDAALTGIAQIADEADVAALASSGLLAPRMPWEAFQRYRYQVDIDGNTNAWEGLFTKLCSGSCVLKVRSSVGYRQWYYDRLVPWINVVPIAADMGDLLDTIDWLRSHDDVAREIGRNGLRLARAMSYDSELLLAERSVTSALREH